MIMTNLSSYFHTDSFVAEKQSKITSKFKIYNMKNPTKRYRRERIYTYEDVKTLLFDGYLGLEVFIT